MRFIVSSTELLKELQILGAVISGNSTLPIIDNFLFELDNQVLKISATDLETSISCELKVESSSSGAIAISAKMFLDILKQFPEQPLTFSADDNNRIEISSSHGNYTMAYVEAKEFPKPIKIADYSTISIQANILAKAINKTIFASSNDDLRPVMNGVLFKLTPEKLVFVATDSHKLSVYERTDITHDKEVLFIMPRKALQLLKGIFAISDSIVNIEFNENNARFLFENTVITCRLIAGKFPNYLAVIPKENPNELVVNRDEILSSIRRMTLFADKSNHQVLLKISGSELTLFAQDISYNNKAEEKLVCQYQGEDMEIAFSSKIFAEMLGVLVSDEVQLSLSEPNKGGILKPTHNLDKEENIFMIVMPVVSV